MDSNHGSPHYQRGAVLRVFLQNLLSKRTFLPPSFLQMWRSFLFLKFRNMRATVIYAASVANFNFGCTTESRVVDHSIFVEILFKCHLHYSTVGITLIVESISFFSIRIGSIWLSIRLLCAIRTARHGCRIGYPPLHTAFRAVPPPPVIGVSDVPGILSPSTV